MAQKIHIRPHFIHFYSIPETNWLAPPRPIRRSLTQPIGSQRARFIPSIIISHDRAQSSSSSSTYRSSSILHRSSRLKKIKIKNHSFVKTLHH
jgi:hypothetical protein